MANVIGEAPVVGPLRGYTALPWLRTRTFSIRRPARSRLLILGDNSFNAKPLTRMLRSLEFAVVVAEDALKNLHFLEA